MSKATANGGELVAVRITHIRCVEIGIVLGSQTGDAFGATAVGERSRMEIVDLFPGASDERDHRSVERRADHRDKRVAGGLKLTLAAFRDHFLATPGIRGRSLDWDASFRKWCRGAVRLSQRHSDKPGKMDWMAAHTAQRWREVLGDKPGKHDWMAAQAAEILREVMGRAA